MLMLIRQKDMKAWTKFKEDFTQVDDDETYEFSEKLAAFYLRQKIAEKYQVEMTPTSPIVKKKVTVKVKEDKKPAKKKAAPKKDIQFYKEGQMQTRSALVLKKEEDIDEYAVNVVKNYFRCLNKANVN